MAVLVTLLAVVVALLVVLVAGLLRANAEILRTLRELGAEVDPGDDGRGATRASGTLRSGVTGPAVDVTGSTPWGEPVSIAVCGVMHPTLLAFVTSTCTTCADFWDALGDDRRPRLPRKTQLVVVTKGEEAESPARLRQLAAGEIPVIMSSSAWDAYDVTEAPYFAFVDGPACRVVRGGAARTWSELVVMMTQPR